MSIANQETHLTFNFQSFYWDFIVKTLLTESLTMWLNSICSSLPYHGGWAGFIWLKAPTSNLMVGPSSMTNPIMSHFVNINYPKTHHNQLISINHQVWSKRATLNNTNTPVTRKIPRVLEVTSQELGTNVSQILYCTSLVQVIGITAWCTT